MPAHERGAGGKGPRGVSFRGRRGDQSASSQGAGRSQWSAIITRPPCGQRP